MFLSFKKVFCKSFFKDQSKVEMSGKWKDRQRELWWERWLCRETFLFSAVSGAAAYPASSAFPERMLRALRALQAHWYLQWVASDQVCVKACDLEPRTCGWPVALFFFFFVCFMSIFFWSHSKKDLKYSHLMAITSVLSLFKTSTKLFSEEEFLPLDPTQELIFPPELMVRQCWACPRGIRGEMPRRVFASGSSQKLTRN